MDRSAILRWLDYWTFLAGRHRRQRAAVNEETLTPEELARLDALLTSSKDSASDPESESDSASDPKSKKVSTEMTLFWVSLGVIALITIISLVLPYLATDSAATHRAKPRTGCTQCAVVSGSAKELEQDLALGIIDSENTPSCWPN